MWTLESLAFTRDSKCRYVSRHFRIVLEANVSCTDNTVLDRRFRWSFGFLRATPRSLVVTFTEEHALVAGGRELERPVRLPKSVRSPTARAAVRRLGDRIAMVIAPHHRDAARSMRAGDVFCREMHDQIVVMDVLKA